MRPAPEWLTSAEAGREPQQMLTPALDGGLTPARQLLHATLVAAGWGLFVWGWVRVTADPTDTVALRTLLLWALLVVPLLTLGWVAHNVGIHRRKGPRRAVPAVRASHEVDFNGRRLDADWVALAAVRRIDIVLDGDRKRFVVVPLPEPQPLMEPATPDRSRP